MNNKIQQKDIHAIIDKDRDDLNELDTDPCDDDEDDDDMREYEEQLDREWAAGLSSFWSKFS